MFLTNCKTTKVEKVTYIPEIDFPEFPALGEYEITEDGKVKTDGEYFRKLLIFKTEYEEMISEYNEKKKLMGENKNEL